MKHFIPRRSPVSSGTSRPKSAWKKGSVFIELAGFALTLFTPLLVLLPQSAAADTSTWAYKDSTCMAATASDNNGTVTVTSKDGKKFTGGSATHTYTLTTAG